MTEAMGKLEAALVKQEEKLADGPGKVVLSSPTGPVGIGLIKAMIEVIREQGAEIEKLKAEQIRGG